MSNRFVWKLQDSLRTDFSYMQYPVRSNINLESTGVVHHIKSVHQYIRVHQVTSHQLYRPRSSVAEKEATTKGKSIAAYQYKKHNLMNM